MAESTLRSEIDNIWDNLGGDDEETPASPEMAVVADDEPETKEAAAQAPAPEAVQPPTEEATPSLTQDERGRFHRPDGTIASKDEVEAFKAGQQPTATAPA